MNLRLMLIQGIFWNGMKTDDNWNSLLFSDGCSRNKTEKELIEQVERKISIGCGEYRTVF